MNKPSHVALYVDNLKRAQAFYGAIFAWEFPSYGPGDFSQITTNSADGGELLGALQSRVYAPIPDKVIGAECTIEVDNLKQTRKNIIAHGGTIVMEKAAVPYVGWLIKFLDTEGNLLCVMERDANAR
ncbi:MAG: VOC family protein [Bacteroidota bacterium]